MNIIKQRSVITGQFFSFKGIHRVSKPGINLNPAPRNVSSRFDSVKSSCIYITRTNNPENGPPPSSNL